MPWCPKCHSEYVDGITECGECNVPLVNEKPEEEITFEDIPEEYVEKFETAVENEEEIIDTHDILRTQASYVKRETRYQDTKDSAVALTVVGLLGIAALILIFTGVIKLPFTMESMIICYIVFVIIFGIFLVVGLVSFKRAKVLKKEALEENQLTDSIKNMLIENFGNGELSLNEELNENELYFARIKELKAAIEKEYGELNERYIDLIIDEVYYELFPDDFSEETE